ncbi:MAG: inositol-phosphate phosphatase [candidate division Zixibacteria bacterium]|nr:inositol-phosphate phosphatase [candidate division Zixibacteria bacterium]
MSKYLQVAMQAVNAMERVTVGYYYRTPRIRTKADRSPVTIADISAEKAAIRVIKAHFPDHAIYGEEGGHRKTDSEFTWIIDPIDGTKNFIRQIPLWGNLLALYHQGEVILGISNVPLMNERLWAERGEGAYLNGDPVKVSARSTLSDAMISFTSVTSFRKVKQDENLLRLLYRTSRQRAFGDLWPYHLLASGKLEIVIEAQIKAFDIAPFVCIIEEAGGAISDIHGQPFSLDIRSFIATNGKLQKRVAGYFKA